MLNPKNKWFILVWFYRNHFYSVGEPLRTNLSCYRYRTHVHHDITSDWQAARPPLAPFLSGSDQLLRVLHPAVWAPTSTNFAKCSCACLFVEVNGVQAGILREVCTHTHTGHRKVWFPKCPDQKSTEFDTRATKPTLRAHRCGWIMI